MRQKSGPPKETSDRVVYQKILAHANKIGADLIVVASHKPYVGDYLLGTTAARIVRHASCSALVVRQTG